MLSTETLNAYAEEARKRDKLGLILTTVDTSDLAEMVEEILQHRPKEMETILPKAPWLESVELAIIANGGGAHKKEMCSCDPSVGMSPCEYCAIWNALNMTFNRLKDMKSQERRRLPPREGKWKGS